MPYGDVGGAATIFPSSGKRMLSASERPKKGKPPCKFGPRDDDGYCPKKPVSSRSSSGKKPKAKRPLKVGRTLPGYVKITAKNPLRAPTTTETIGGALAGRAFLPAIKRAAGPILKAAQGIGARAALKEAAGATTGILGTAGLLAYELAKFGLGIRDRKKLDLQEQAFRASQAYRAYREKLAGDQGRPLTQTQLKQTASIFQSELLKLGLSTNDLKKIMGATIYDRGHDIASR